MIGRRLGAFEMYVGYRTVRFAVTKPEGRGIAIWQDRHLVAELDPVEVNKSFPWVRYRDLMYSATMSDEWKTHFTRWVVRIWRDHHASSAEQPTEVAS